MPWYLSRSARPGTIPVRTRSDPTRVIEGGTGDRHAIMVDPATCTDYELYDTFYTGPTTSHAANGAVWNLNSDALRGGRRRWTPRARPFSPG